MAEANALKNVLQALEALYMGSGNRDAANRFLMDFPRHKEAWVVSVKLLETPPLQCMFYGANTLYDKTKADWHTLGQKERERIFSLVMPNYGKLCASKGSALVPGRLARTIAYAYFHTHKDPKRFMQLVFEKKKTPVYALNLLEAVSLEVDTANLSHRTITLIKKEFKRHSVHVLQLIRSYLMSPNLDKSTQLLALRCFMGWIILGVMPLRLQEKQGMLPVLVNCLRRSPDHLQNVCDIWRESMQRANRKSDYRAAEMVIAHIAQLGGQLDGAIRSNDDDMARQISIALCEVGETCCDIIAKGSRPSLSFVHAVGKCTAHPNLDVSVLSLDFWLALQDIPTRERHENLRAQTYFNLLKVLLVKLQYPESPDAADFHMYRSKTVDILVSAFYLLGKAFLDYVAGVFQKAVASRNVRTIEACAFCLGAISREIIAGGRKGLLMNQQVVGLIRNILGALMQASTEAKNRMLYFTTLATVSKFAPLLADDPKLRKAAIVLTAKPPLVVPENAVFFDDEGNTKGFLCQLGETFAKMSNASLKYLAADQQSVANIAKFVQGSNPRLLLMDRKDASLNIVTSDLAACQREFVKTIVKLYANLKDPGQLRLHVILMEPHAKILQNAITVTAEDSTQQNVQKKAKLFQRMVQLLTLLDEVLRVLQYSPRPDIVHDVIQMYWGALAALYKLSWNLDQKKIVDEEFDLSLAVHQVTSTVLICTNGRSKFFAQLIMLAGGRFKKSLDFQCLRTLKIAVETFGKDPSNHSGFQQIFASVAQPTFELVMSGRNLADYYELLAAFMSLAEKMLLCCPVVTLDRRSGFLERILKMMPTIVTGAKDRAVATPSVKFLKNIMKASTSSLSPQVKSYIVESLVRAGGEISLAFLMRIASRSDSTKSFASGLYNLWLPQSPQTVQKWITTALGHRYFNDKLTSENKRDVWMTVQHQLQKGRLPRSQRGGVNPEGLFKAFMEDFGEMSECGGEHVNRLLAYHLRPEKKGGSFQHSTPF
mmetsp:Transcript_13763/g.26240  ORF Transcript_13763/g.26240 Transcript_13763/m.26240 type:complete len:997 (-) Transcript_13763:244-3234(-)